MKIDKEYLYNLVGKKVRFKDCILEWESYAEPGMHAIVTKWHFDSSAVPIHKIWFNFEPFEEDNHKRQNANYYNESGKAVLTAVEAGFYSREDDYYLSDDIHLIPFEVVD